jgi:lipopolysaccharide/colanic/teichoic acid biosynthesis glycosyltransferase
MPVASLDNSRFPVSEHGQPVIAPGFAHLLAKRTLDVVAALVGMVILLPVYAVISVALLVVMGRPIFFRQIRAGLHNRPIRLLKFRTMTNDRDASGNLLPDTERLTSFGRFLRRWSLDELPQLWNVLAGDLSLVGPRPLPMRYVPRYDDRQRLRLLVTPGITGMAQVNGRNALNWESRLELDVQYCERASLWLDLNILLLTVREVLSRNGVCDDGSCPEFWGITGKPANSPNSYPVDENELC